MRNILISSSYGSGNSLLKSLTLPTRTMDSDLGTCHDAWLINETVHNDFIRVEHSPTVELIEKESGKTFNMTVWVRINEKNLQQICQRIVVLDFLYATDPDWILSDGAWTQDKHDKIQGANWPTFSTNIHDYPGWCLDEICRTAYHRCEPWTKHNKDFDFEIDSDELFGDAEPVTIQRWLTAVGCQLDREFLTRWKQKQQQLFERYKNLFDWDRVAVSHIENLSTMDKYY